ncbi:LacI family DNA-binding transcriptional regulator [Spirochaetia bacterium 38H-sp]|uniref:LacI family DNA-binding transcriptional regulator n=1 Tax=Rarispira pelagica TaxID=3141764 RepID=A0ABU9UC82_9SPIR
MKKKITISDVAREAGVSISTVSNYLNGREELLRPDTRKRVERAISDLEYRPNPVARQLKTGNSPFIGLIVPSVANPFYGVFAQYVESAAAELGYHVLLGNCSRDPGKEKEFAEQLFNYGVRGVVFGSSLVDVSYLSDLIKEGLRLVTFDRSSAQGEKMAFDAVGVDNWQGMYIATRHLLGLGHRRIGFVSGPIKTISRINRLEGYKKALIDAGIEPDPDIIWQMDVSAGYGDSDAIRIGRKATQQLLASPNPPTAIVAINAMFAMGVYSGAREMGVSIPDELSVVGFDDIDLAEIVNPPLTTIRQPLADMASKAVELLVNRLDGKHDGDGICHTFPAELVVRHSTDKPKAR